MTTITKEHAQKIIDAADNVITALAGTNDDFHPDNSEKMCGLWDDLNDRYAPPEVVRELARAMLASLTAEPVAWTDELELNDVEKDGLGYLFTVNPITPNADPRRVIKLYAAPPAQVVSIPDDWQTCEKLSDDSYVDNALRELVEDTTGDNGVRVVQAVIRALRDSGLIRTYPDLSQPVDPQVAEYEQIMLQAGWVMVPVEPTDEMIAAAMECDDVVFDSKDPTAFRVQHREIYYAMVDAAPKQENI